MKIIVVTPIGTHPFPVQRTAMLMSDFVKEVANHFNFDQSKIKLFLKNDFTGEIKTSEGTIKSNLRTARDITIYLDLEGGITNGTQNQATTTTTTTTAAAATTATTTTATIKRTMGFNFNDKQFDTPKVIRFQSKWGGNSLGTEHLKIMKKKEIEVELQSSQSSTLLVLGSPCLNNFINKSRKDNFKVHRIAFLFGRINKKTGQVTVHCSYEPPQSNNKNHVYFNHDLNLPIKVAEMFNMECVGMAISRNSELNDKDQSSENVNLLTRYVMTLAAEFQGVINQYFTTVIITPVDNNQESCQAYQVVDALVELRKNNLISDNSLSSKCIGFTKLVKVGEKYCSECERESVSLIVGIKESLSKIPVHDFPPASEYPTEKSLSHYIETHSYPPWIQFFDFNLLCFLLENQVITEEEMKLLVNSIIEMKDPSVLIKRKINKYAFANNQ